MRWTHLFGHWWSIFGSIYWRLAGKIMNCIYLFGIHIWHWPPSDSIISSNLFSISYIYIYRIVFLQFHHSMFIRSESRKLEYNNYNDNLIYWCFLSFDAMIFITAILVGLMLIFYEHLMISCIVHLATIAVCSVQWRNWAAGRICSAPNLRLICV